MEGCGNTLGCINCHGGRSAAFRQCPEMPVHARAHVLRSGNYIPFSVALQRARVELLGGPFSPEPTGQRNIKPEPDRCWAAAAAANPLTTGTRPAPLYATVAARGVVGRKGRGRGGLRAGRRPSEVGQPNKLIQNLNPGTPYRQASR